MSDKKKLYLKVLKIELEDLNDDIEMLIDELQHKKDNKEISNYVFVENLSLFRNEIIGVEVVNESLEKINTNDFASLDDLISEIKVRIKKRITECGIRNALWFSIERKLDKVKKYIS